MLVDSLIELTPVRQAIWSGTGASPVAPAGSLASQSRLVTLTLHASAVFYGETEKRDEQTKPGALLRQRLDQTGSQLHADAAWQEAGAMRLPIHLQREIVRLHFQDTNRANREIARSVGVSQNTVGEVRKHVRNADVAWEKLQGLDDDQWTATLKNQDRSIAKRKPAPDWQHIYDEMQRPHATLEQLWLEFKESCPAGVQYTQFAEGFKEWKKRLGVVMRQTHRPGEKLFVDFAGPTVPITNPEDGTTRPAQIFVAVLGCSNFAYVEARESQKIPDWLDCHIDTFDAFGGATEWVVSDNLKSAVTRNKPEYVQITPEYREMLRHYNSAPLPAGPVKPKHKAKAEGGVLIVERWILFRLRDRVFFSLEELNQELKRLCALLNDHPFKKLPGTRRTRFEELERRALRPLPSQPYEYAKWRYKVLVRQDHHVEHEKCFYSVPYHLVREKVDLRVTDTVVEIMYRGRRVTMHDRLNVPGDARTKTEHRPIVHQRVLDGEPKALSAWAAQVGPYSAKMIEFHLASRADPTNGLRAARRMRRLADEYGEKRFEEVCKYALPLSITALRSVTSILKEAADKRQRPTTPPATPTHHENVRGPDYYGDDKE